MHNIDWKHIIFLGPLYQNEQESDIINNSKVKPSSAPNLFQWNLLHGMQQKLKHGIQIINVLPVGVWPKQYNSILLPNKVWNNNGAECYEVGCINLPFIKQFSRTRRIKRLLKKRISDGMEIIVYSAYMPFLKAAYRLPPSVKVTTIITDLPEFYDLGQTSVLKKFLRKIQNRMIYRYLKRVDRFILLTEQMKEPLHVDSRPWMVLEGICESNKYIESHHNQERIILYTGTLHYKYGIKNLLDAFTHIKDTNVELWICGNGEAETEILKLEKCDQRVHYWGFCDQKTVKNLREQATILVNPRTNKDAYTKYSFPSKTMEYMASGKPVVMYKLDGVPEEYYPYLYLVKENSMDSLKDVLQYVLSHHAEAIQRGKEAQRFVLDNKNEYKQAERLLDFLS